MNKLSEAEHKKRRGKLKLSFGGWKGTNLDNDKLWKSILTRKSRAIDWFKDWGKK